LADERTPAPFRVEFSQATNCGKPEEFSTELLRRSQHVRPARLGEEGFGFFVDVQQNEGSLEGRLTLREPDGRVTVRVVPGATCGEVIPALAVIAAVLVEPSAAAVEPEPLAAPVARPEPTGWGVGASIGLVIQGAVAPDSSWGITLEAHTSFESGSLLSPLFALAYSQTETGEDRTPNGVAQLDWWTVRATACPVRWPEAGRVAGRPCGFFDLGRFHAEGTETERQADATMTWVAPGLSARLDAAAVDWLWLTAEAGVFLPLNRDKFFFEPRPEDAFRPPWIGGLARLAAGGRFQ
jgi:hypothetical protein